MNKRLAKEILWTLFAWVPASKEFVFWLVRHGRRLLRIPHQGHYAALRLIDDTPGELYLDVGASHGQSIESIRLYKKNRIISFEANPLVGARLKDRYPDVEVHAFGLGRECGDAVLHVPAYGTQTYESRASLRRDVAHDFIDEAPIYGFNPGRARIETVACEIRTLDSLGVRPSFIKIDVEGTEAEVIEGGMGTIRSCLPIMMVEVVTPAMMRRLAPLGYRAYGYVRGALVEGARAEGDIFLIPDSKRDRIRMLKEPAPSSAAALA